MATQAERRAARAERVKAVRAKATTPPWGFPAKDTQVKDRDRQYIDTERWSRLKQDYSSDHPGWREAALELRRAPALKGLPRSVPLLGPVVRTGYKQGQLDSTNYSRLVVFGDGEVVKVPTDHFGQIKMTEATYRFLNQQDEGTRAAGKRSPMVDLGVDAVIQHDPADALSFDWWRRINESDLPGVDDTKSPILAARLDDPGLYKAVASLQVVDATRASEATKAKRAKEIKDRLKLHFTIKERQMFKRLGMVITVKPLPSDVAGQQWRNNIAIDPKVADGDPFVLDDVVIHEAIHWLRENEEKRGEKLAIKSLEYTWRRGSNEDRDLEEAMTEAETVSRLRNYDADSQRPAGYWRYVKGIKRRNPGKGKDADGEPWGRYQHADRVLFTKGLRIKRPEDAVKNPSRSRGRMFTDRTTAGGGLRLSSGKAEGKQAITGEWTVALPSGEIVPFRDVVQGTGVKGELAKRRVVKWFPESNIGTMRKFAGKAEAIDQYHKVNDPSGGGYTLHSYSPNAEAKAGAIEAAILEIEPPGTAINAWEDGRLARSGYQARYSTRRGPGRKYGPRIYDLIKRPMTKREAEATARAYRERGLLARRVKDAQGRWWVYRGWKGRMIDPRSLRSAARSSKARWGQQR